MISALLFDLDGVVIDSEPLWDLSQIEFLGRRGITYEKGMKHLITGKSVVEGVRVMQSLYGFAGDAAALAAERRAIVRELFETRITFMPGFEEFYQRERVDRATCIATALDRELLHVVDRRLGLGDLFGANLFTIADVGMRSKPDPEIFLHSARALNTPPDRCLVFEDAPYGIEAARRAGMRCIALTTTYPREQLLDADEVVDGFGEIVVR